MQMNDIIDGLNSCDYPAGPPVGPVGVGPIGCGGGFTGGCGFGSWIWILLILFYTNQGGRGRYGGHGKYHHDDEYYYGRDKGRCGGGYCGGYLFLLVILFLCNGCNTIGCCGFDQGFDGALGGIC